MTFRRIFHLDKQIKKGRFLFPSHPRKGAPVFQQLSDLQKWYQTQKKDCKGHPATTSVPCSLARPGEPVADPAPRVQLLALPCPPHPHSNAQGLSLRLIKLYTQNYLSIGRPTVSTAQERCLVSLETQISAEEFELWSCFIHIMLLSPTFTSICSLVVNSFPSNRMAAK